MKLFHSPSSPFVRKVCVVLHELDKCDAVEQIPVATTPFTSAEPLVASAPLGKIPSLERPEGATLYDSRVICAYLNDRFDGTLYPQGDRRWEALTLEATGDGIMDAAVSMTYEVRLRPEDQQSPDWIEAQWAKASRTIAAINTRWMSHLHGPLDIGQISVACALSYVDFRHDARNWRVGNDALAKWHAEFDSRASMQATLPPTS
ncbi:MAG: glutathione S-transferase family protein [Sulfitobacter sp.]